MTLNNFSENADRSVVEYYAGTMQPLTSVSTLLDSSRGASDIYSKHRRASKYNDYLIYCAQSSRTGVNIYLNNKTKTEVINVKLIAAMDISSQYGFDGNWHIKTTSRGFQYFLPVTYTYGLSPQAPPIYYQFGEYIIDENGEVTLAYETYLQIGTSGTQTNNPIAIVDFNDNVFLVFHVSSNVYVSRIYYRGIEDLSAGTQVESFGFQADSGETTSDLVWGITSSDLDNNFIFFNSSAHSYAFSISGISETAPDLFVRPIKPIISDSASSDFDVVVARSIFASGSVVTLDERFHFERSIEDNQTEVPLWHNAEYGLSTDNPDSDTVNLINSSYAEYAIDSVGDYRWVGYANNRAYIPYFDNVNGFYRCFTSIEDDFSDIKSIRQNDFDNSYQPVAIPIQGEYKRFITYYGVENGVSDFYLTMAVPNIIENDKGVFYPQFLGEEEGTVVLDGEANYLRYERIGNIVHVFGVVEVASSTGVGSLKMNNLPYPISNEFLDVDFTLDQAFPKLTPIKKSGSDYYTLYFCTSQSDQTLTSVATAVALTPRWVFNFRYMTN